MLKNIEFSEGTNHFPGFPELPHGGEKFLPADKKTRMTSRRSKNPDAWGV